MIKVSGEYLYLGNGSSTRIAPYQAMYVFIREGPPTEYEYCMDPSSVLPPCKDSIISNN